VQHLWVEMQHELMLLHTVGALRIATVVPPYSKHLRTGVRTAFVGGNATRTNAIAHCRCITHSNSCAAI
jgi:hypothetical protein